MGLDTFQFSLEDFARAMREGSVRRMCARSRSRPSITTILLGSQWSCLLLRIVLQDALSEVTQIYPPLRLRAFVDDITALTNGRNKELVFEKIEQRGRGKGLDVVDH